MKGRTKSLYSIYDAKTDEPVAICLPAYECGLALFNRWHRLVPKDRKKVEQKFYDTRSKCKNGHSKRWIIIREDNLDDDDE